MARPNLNGNGFDARAWVASQKKKFPRPGCSCNFCKHPKAASETLALCELMASGDDEGYLNFEHIAEHLLRRKHAMKSATGTTVRRFLQAHHMPLYERIRGLAPEG